MKLTSSILVLFGGVLCLSMVDCACNFPPRLWCSSEDIKHQCGVVDQCKQQDIGDQADPVDFALYFESLCPDCKEFMTSQLYKTWKALGTQVMNLTLVPYGNAREKKDVFSGEWKFDCQHGKEECVGNLIETCAMALLKDINIYFPFIYCIEAQNIDVVKAASQCATQHQVDIGSIMACANGTLGNQLEHAMAVQTDALSPQHEYVPWVTLNGVHNKKIQNEAEDDLLKLICDTYQGTAPDACQNAKRTSKIYKHSQMRNN